MTISTASASRATPAQEIRFGRGPDGVRLAYASHGHGPPDPADRLEAMFAAWRERCPIYLALLNRNPVGVDFAIGATA